MTTITQRDNAMKFKYLLMRAAQHGVAHVLGSILFLGGAGIGLSMILSPNNYLSYPSLHQNFMFASPTAWGTAFLVASAALVISIYVEPAYAQLPALILGAIFIIFGILTLFSSATALVVWAFIALGWISVFTQVICWAEEKRESAHHYEPN